MCGKNGLTNKLVWTQVNDAKARGKMQNHPSTLAVRGLENGLVSVTLSEVSRSVA